MVTLEMDRLSFLHNLVSFCKHLNKSLNLYLFSKLLKNSSKNESLCILESMKKLWLLIGLLLLTACSGLLSSYPGSPTPGGSVPPGDSPPPGGGTNPQAGILTAGEIDENLNLNALQKYLEQPLNTQNQFLPSFSTKDRVSIEIRDNQGQGVANARVQVLSGNTSVFEGVAGANGVLYLYPSYDTITATQLTLQVRLPTGNDPATQSTFNLETLPTDRRVQVNLNATRETSPALDLMLVIDATGSMTDEMKYLSSEFQAITQTIKNKFPTVSIRFSLIVYRDVGDEYVIRSFDFTDSVATMQSQLAAQQADGGGDYPEAMEQALQQVTQANWRTGNTTRLVFLVADAPPHDQDLSKAINSAKTARRMGLRFYPLAASGVAETAEYMMRSMAVTTHGRYLFLTDDSGVGNSHSEPKIPCYVTTRLDHLLTRVVASELSGARVEANQQEIIRTVGQPNAGVCN